MIIEENGIKLWFGTSDAPAPVGQVSPTAAQTAVVGIQSSWSSAPPPSPGHRPASPAVNNNYSVVLVVKRPGLSQVEIEAKELSKTEKKVYFRAAFPPVFPGQKVQYYFRLKGLPFPFPNQPTYVNFEVKLAVEPAPGPGIPPGGNPGVDPEPSPEPGPGPISAPGTNPPPGTNPVVTPPAPALLQPIKLETRFVEDELWIRFVPDPLFLNRSGHQLAPEEEEAWTLYMDASAEDQKAAWRRLVAQLGVYRAAWLVHHQGKVPLSDENEQDIYLRTLPDRFAVYLYQNGQRIGPKYGNRISSPLMALDPALPWESDFEQAVKIGMGIQIKVNTPNPHFDRIVVVGIPKEDPTKGKVELLDLLHGHYYTNGLAFLAPDTPTNNTQAKGRTPYSVEERRDADSAYSWVFQEEEPASDTYGGQVAEALGLTPSDFSQVKNTGQREATVTGLLKSIGWLVLGNYAIELLLGKQYTPAMRAAIWEHHDQWVQANGPLPCLKVGRNPYGLLPVARVLRKNQAQVGPKQDDFSAQLRTVTSRLFDQFLERAASPGAIPRIGAEGNDPDQELMQVLSMQPRSVTHAIRPIVDDATLEDLIKKYIQSPSTLDLVKDLIKFHDGTEGNNAKRDWGAIKDNNSKQASLLLEEIANPDSRARLFDLLNFGQAVPLQEKLGMPLVGEPVLFSETFINKLKQVFRTNGIKIPSGLQAITVASEKFSGSILEELLDRALDYATREDITDQLTIVDAGFKSPPAAGIAIQQSFQVYQVKITANDSVTTGMTLLSLDVKRPAPMADGSTETITTTVDLKSPYSGTVTDIMVQAGQKVSYDTPLLSIRHPDEVLHDKLIQHLADLFRLLASGISKTRSKNLAVALAQTLDLSSYRLDAWITSIASRQLSKQREEERKSQRTPGLYLGAFGWLEDLRKDPNPVTASWELFPEIEADRNIQDLCLFQKWYYAVTDEGTLQRGPDLRSATLWGEQIDVGPEQVTRVAAGTDHLFVLADKTLSWYSVDTQGVLQRIGSTKARRFSDMAFHQGSIIGLKKGKLFRYGPRRAEGSRLAWRRLSRNLKIDSLTTFGNKIWVLRKQRIYEVRIQGDRPQLTELGEALNLTNLLALNDHFLGRIPVGQWVRWGDLRYKDLYQREGGGIIHAPSVPQAMAGALARNAYLSHRDQEEAGNPFALALLSDRIQGANRLHTGIRHQQELSALLGYAFERSLHDSGDDKYIYEYRLDYPLVPKYQDEEDTSLNVVDGLAVINQVAPDDGQTEGVKQAIQKITDLRDASSDTLLFEALFQSVQGNYDRAAAAMEATTGERLPPVLESLQTKVPGTGLTHKLIYLLGESTENPDTYKNKGNWRAYVEPNLEGWLKNELGGLENIGCQVHVFRPLEDGAQEIIEEAVSLPLEDLGLGYLDLLALSNTELEDGRSGLEQRIAAWVREDRQLPPGLEYRVLPFAATDDKNKNLSELLEMLRYLNQLLHSGKAMQSSDLLPPALEKHAVVSYADWKAVFDRIEISCGEYARSRDLLESLENIEDNPSEEQKGAFKTAARFGLAAALIVFQDETKLLQTAPSLVKEMYKALAQYQMERAKIRKVLELVEDAPLPPSYSIDAATYTFLCAQLEKAAQALFGPSFQLLLPARLPQAFLEQGHHKQAELLGTLGQGRIWEWVQGWAAVTPGLETFEDAVQLLNAWSERSSSTPLYISQFTAGKAHPWIALDRSERQVIAGIEPATPYPRGACAIVTNLDLANASAEARLYGLTLFQQAEHLPDRQIETGVSYQYDAPNSEPPQSLLLAVAEPGQKKWTPDTLADIVNDTLDLAKVRMLDLDSLQSLGVFFPATFLPFNTSYAQQGTRTLSPGSQVPEPRTGNILSQSSTGTGIRSLDPQETTANLILKQKVGPDGLTIELPKAGQQIYLTVRGPQPQLLVQTFDERNQLVGEQAFELPDEEDHTLPLQGSSSIARIRVFAQAGPTTTLVQKIRYV